MTLAADFLQVTPEGNTNGGGHVEIVKLIVFQTSLINLLT